MLKTLWDKFPFPEWADQRTRRLMFLDAALDGNLYNALPGSFYDDLLAGGKRLFLRDRRPSTPYNLPRYVARQSARKLFAGRHAPKFTHPDDKVAAAAEGLMREGFLKSRILQAAVWGSVGSVAVTFCILPGGEGVPRIVFDVWRSVQCWPILDELGELKSLRIAYPILGKQVLGPKLNFERDAAGDLVGPHDKYWFVRDYLTGREITYVPWKLGTRLKDGTEVDRVILRLPPEEMVQAPKGHEPQLDYPVLGDVLPAHWFINLAGGEYPDGASTWEDALPFACEISYTMSNLGRGVRYNGTPRLAVVGPTVYEVEDVARNRQMTFDFDSGSVLRLAGGASTGTGQTREAGDAKLLEMRGNGMKAGLDYIERVRKYGLEIVGASRKDPDRSHWPQSGKAMEMLDEDNWDLIAELRTSYGDYGLLPLIKKAMTVAAAAGHPLMKGVDLAKLDQLALDWPAPYLPGAQEFYQYAQALSILVKGAPSPGDQPTPTAPKGGDGGEGKEGAGDKPSSPAPMQEGILTVEKARKLLDLFLDMPPANPPVAVQQRARDGDVGTEPQASRPEENQSESAGKSLLTNRYPKAGSVPGKETSLNPPPYRGQ